MFKPAAFRRPTIHLWLGAAIIAAFVAEMLASPAQQREILNTFAIIPARYGAGGQGFDGPLQALAPLFGHVFLHGGYLHIGMNMLVYFQIAPFLVYRLSEQGGGGVRFLAFFFGTAAAGALLYIWINPGSDIPAVGASGAICGLFGGYLLGARRDWRTALRDPQIRRAGFWFLVINVGLMGLASASGLLPIAWEAHLGGFLGGLALFPLIAPRRSAMPGPWG